MRPDYRAMDLAIFAGKDPGGVLWQPRLEFWYSVNKKRGTMPPHLRDADILDVYDYCHASVRYFGNGLRLRYKNVEYSENWDDENHLRHTWKTPVGKLSEVWTYDEWNLSFHWTDYRLQTPDDFKTLAYVLDDEEWYWDQHAYEQEIARFGAYGAPQFFFRRSPFQRLFIEEMGFQNTVYWMHDYPDMLQAYLEMTSTADDKIYDVLCACPLNIINLGENIAAHMDSPRIWKTYLTPYYRKRVDQLKAAGKYVHIHIDGTMKPLLPYLHECAWDGIEAATPVPQGDVTLEEIKEALGDLVLLDGIPALYFLPSYAESDLIACTKRVVELFYPHLVLGISDEIPPDGDIERVRLVGELVKNLV